MSSCPSDDTFSDFIESRLTGTALDAFCEHASSCHACAASLAELLHAAAPAPLRPLSDTDAPVGNIPDFLHRWNTHSKVAGRYRLIEVLGAGGMGIVYLARDTQLNRNVALKITRTGVSRAGAQRLLREAQAMAQLSHRNVVAVHDVGVWQDHIFVAMEYLEGGTLASYLLKGRRPWPDVLEKFVQAGLGLAAAHRAAIVHRDFKPENVLLSATGEVRVADFGLARLLTDETAEPLPSAVGAPSKGDPSDALRARLTRMGTLLGTPSYMSPEQTNHLVVDHRADIWSFCVALYEALYCELPFPGRTPSEVSHYIELGSIRSVPIGSDVPKWLRRALLRGLRADITARYSTMDELLAALSPQRPAGAHGRRALATLTSVGVIATLGVLFAAWGGTARSRERVTSASRFLPTVVALDSSAVLRPTERESSASRRLAPEHTAPTATSSASNASLSPVSRVPVPHAPSRPRPSLAVTSSAVVDDELPPSVGGSNSVQTLSATSSLGAPIIHD